MQGDRVTEAEELRERRDRWFSLPSRAASLGLRCPLARKGGDSDERANLQRTFYREFVAANGGTGCLDRRAGNHGGEIRLVTRFPN